MSTSTNTMLQGLLRRRRWAERRWSGRHWSAWAQALAARYGFASMRGGAGMTWLAPMGGIHLHNHRWSAGDRTFSPTIVLALQRLLRQVADLGQRGPDREGAASAARGVLRANPAAAAMAARASGHLHPSAAMTVLGPLKPLDAPAISAGGRAPNAPPDAQRGAAPHVPRPLLVWSPVARALARADAAAETASRTSPTGRYEGAYRADRLSEISRRLAERHQRVELLTPRSIVTRQPAQAPLVVNLPEGVALTSTMSEGTGIAPPPDVPPAWTEVEVQRVADQVVRQLDRRLTAQRERLGRSF